MPRSTALSLYLMARSSDPAAEELPDWPERPEGELVWFHTGRAEPTPAVLALAARLAAAREGLSVLLTSAAPGIEPRPALDAGAAAHLLPAPPERTGAARRFLEHWRPDVAVWTECDLRPALVSAASRAGVPLLMLDAGTARPQTGALRWRPGMTRALMAVFSRVLAGDAPAAAEFRRMGVARERIELTGPLEEVGAALPCNEAEHEAMVELVAGRQLWLAHCVTPDEVSIAVRVHQRLLAHAHRLLLLLRPARCEDGAELARRLKKEGWSAGFRGAGDEPEEKFQIYIVDSDSEDGLWFRLAPISFLGSSLHDGPGCNPFAAAALGSAILHGPNVPAHEAAYSRLARVGAARTVRNESELFVAVEELLSPDRAARMARAAWELASSGAEVTDRAMELIFEALES